MSSLTGLLLSFGFLFIVFLLLLIFVLKAFHQIVSMRKFLRINIMAIIGMGAVIIIGFLKNFYSITFMLVIPVAIQLFCIRNVVLHYRGRKY
ncbi:hypothetical protein HUG15_20255 [Salicibibacter cibarius]|uniref:Uncharacterized protein n=1 Tax=Salicibibacter cibarius TaxID=2743000 RepID=A0A7T7CD69_9BACI|nr:hypothetical protein [Salicibibacter cibarius]QQK77687.1 hypothetical protein HUG15_20255 [Salicibibacter cibarius]